MTKIILVIGIGTLLVLAGSSLGWAETASSLGVSPRVSLASDLAGDQSGKGDAYADILSAWVIQQADKLVFIMTVNDKIPASHPEYVSYGFNLDVGTGLGKIWVGAGCTDCASGVWNPAIGRWNADWTHYTLTPLQADTLFFSYNTVIFVVPLSELGGVSSLNSLLIYVVHAPV